MSHDLAGDRIKSVSVAVHYNSSTY